MSKIITVTVGGSKKTVAMLDRMRSKYPGAFAAALFQKGAEIFAESQEEVPVDTGRLRSSGGVYPPRFIRWPVVRIGYGTRYGLYVHEDSNARHGPVIGRGKGQTYKYLEDPFKRALPMLHIKILRFFRRNIEQGSCAHHNARLRGKPGFY